jgi:hypothetical protein
MSILSISKIAIKKVEELLVFKLHRHHWEIIDNSDYEEVDCGVGMQPIIHNSVYCTVCGSHAIRTEHPLYGDVIRNVVINPDFKQQTSGEGAYQHGLSDGQFSNQLVVKHGYLKH